LALLIGVRPGKDFRDTPVWRHFAERAGRNNLTLFEKAFAVPVQEPPINCPCGEKQSLLDTFKNHRCFCWRHGGLNE